MSRPASRPLTGRSSTSSTLSSRATLEPLQQSSRQAAQLENENKVLTDRLKLLKDQFDVFTHLVVFFL